MFGCLKPHSFLFFSILFSSDDVYDREHDHPHCVDEMPVERQHIEPVRILVRHVPQNRKRHYREQDKSHRDVERM